MQSEGTGFAIDPPDDDSIDEMERESFPASDAPSTWSGSDQALDARPKEVDPIPEAVPEADDPAVTDAWEDAESMDGQAPTG